MRLQSLAINKRLIEGPQKFVVGTLVPLKGVLFEIESVEPKRLVLKPRGLTSGERKRRDRITEDLTTR